MIPEERAGRDATIAGGEGDIDALYAKLARQVGEVFTPYQDVEALGIMDYPKIRRGILAALVPVFGKKPGDESAELYQLLVRRAEREWGRIFDTHATIIRDQLKRDPELYEHVQAIQDNAKAARVKPDVETWRDPKGRRLIDRVWLAREDTWQRLDREIRVALVMKEPPLAVGMRLRRWLSPAHSNTRNRLGVLQ